MTERPILFSAPMVRAILAGTKTQTRRAMRPQPPSWVKAWNGSDGDRHHFFDRTEDDESGRHWPDYEAPGARCPYGQVGDHLWVRETWRTYASLDDVMPSRIRDGAGIEYPAGGSSLPGKQTLHGMGRVRPSIHMPRAFSRITLEITNAYAEPLHDLTEAEAVAEGIPADPGDRPIRCGEEALRDTGPIELLPTALTARETFQGLWNSINGPGAWDANPWVWVLTFRRLP